MRGVAPNSKGRIALGNGGVVEHMAGVDEEKVLPYTINHTTR